MNFQQLINSITPEIYENLKRGLELGKWSDGTPLTQEQKEHAMAAVIAYGQQFLMPEQRVGYIDAGEKEGDSCGSVDGGEESPVRFI